MTKFIMLDRDGVINYDSKEYIKTPDEWRPIPGSAEAIARLSKGGYKIGIASNQSGVARGLYSEQTLAAIHQKMLSIVEAAGGTIHKIVYCTHLPDSGCPCRKPNPGMLYELANFFNAVPKGHYFVGDRLTDVEAAWACGASPILIRSQMTQSRAENLSEVPVYDSLAEVAADLLRAQDAY